MATGPFDTGVSAISPDSVSRLTIRGESARPVPPGRWRTARIVRVFRHWPVNRPGTSPPANWCRSCLHVSHGLDSPTKLEPSETRKHEAPDSRRPDGRNVGPGDCGRANQDPPGEAVTVTATVEAIERGTRSLTLKGPEGKLVTITVPDE